LEEALHLAVKVLSKTMDSTVLDSEKLEFGTMTFDARGLPIWHLYNAKEIGELISKVDLKSDDTDKEKEKKKD